MKSPTEVKSARDKGAGMENIILTQAGFIKDNVPGTKNRVHGVQELSFARCPRHKAKGNRENK
jgi:hypothetical protein